MRQIEERRTTMRIDWLKLGFWLGYLYLLGAAIHWIAG